MSIREWFMKEKNCIYSYECMKLSVPLYYVNGQYMVFIQMSVYYVRFKTLNPGSILPG